jgi:hypothetical protein
MATYQGPTTALIRLPGDRVSVNPSRLVILSRSYACAAAYAPFARSILVRGRIAEEYPLLRLFTPPSESTDGAIVTFSCLYYGVFSAADYNQPFLSRTSQMKSGTFDNYAFQYPAPILSMAFVLPEGVSPSYAPPSSDLVQGGLELPYNNLTQDGVTVFARDAYFEQVYAWAGKRVNLVSSSSVNYGAVNEVTLQFDLSLLLTLQYGLGPYDDQPKG